MSEANRELVVRFIDALRRGDPGEAARSFHRDYRSHSWGGDLATTWERMQEAAAAGAISDVELLDRIVLADGDRVVCYSHSQATHTGTFLGVPATGRRFDLHWFEMWRVEDDRLIEHWGGIREHDRLHQQLTS